MLELSSVNSQIDYWSSQLCPCDKHQIGFGDDCIADWAKSNYEPNIASGIGKSAICVGVNMDLL